LARQAIELGCTFWDTASVYAAGMNEKMLGDFIRNHNVRDKVFIASKCGFAIFEKAGITNSAEHIKKYIDGTIERLGFAPDLYYLHRVDPNTPLEESIPALNEIRKAGKTKFIGLSECSAKTLRKANDIAKIDAVEAEYSAFETVHETGGLIEACKDLGVAFVAYSPLGHGWLVDDFPYKSPDDFAADDLRRTCKFLPTNLPLLSCYHCTDLTSHSSQIPRRELLQEQSYCRGNQEVGQQKGLWYHTNCSCLGCRSRLHRHPWNHQATQIGRELCVERYFAEQRGIGRDERDSRECKDSW
jgi:aryl-alcohol dehydrogenase-like predicted oxidoreductase